MNIDDKIQKIDAEIKTRSSKNFGIKVGEELFKALVKAGKIKGARFSVMGTSLFEMELPAYDSSYAVFLDIEMNEAAFEVGQPSD